MHVLILALLVASGATADPGTQSQSTTVNGAAEQSQQASATPPPPADPEQRIVCRREPVTGSNARFERVCLTVAQWRERRDGGNRTARDMVEYTRGRPAGGP